MSIFAAIKAKNWFERRIQTALKNKKISILIILILISGFFFYNQLITIFPNCYADDYGTGGYLEHEREWIGKINYAEVVFNNQEGEKRKIYSINGALNFEKPEKIGKEDVKNQIYQLVGNAPIGEMIPSVLKLDSRVGAFIIGIAKKESDWGRHAPTQAGRTCYNYWGYKGTGSRGVSMGYACFGSPEEAVEIVGKRIENLISKNINEPRKMLVWKCGSSCAGHDPGGVQKWVSDVSLYFGKVMKIQNT
jgi:hypothetical protein